MKKWIIHKTFVIGLALLLAAAALQVCSRKIPGFADWYYFFVYRGIVGVFGRITGMFSFSVVEMLLYLLILWMVLGVIWAVRRKKVLRFAGWIVCLAGVLALLYTANCGVNYYRRSFADQIGLKTSKYSAEELKKLCEYLTEQVNEEVKESEIMPAERLVGDGSQIGISEQVGLHAKIRKEEWKAESVASMQKLGQTYPVLAGYYPKPKDLLIDEILSWQQVTGVYSPFTAEANVNGDIPDYNLPHTMCHELSHLKGFMREEEANFIGYLACIGSDDAYFRYSGYLSGWVYAGNALARTDRESYYALYDKLCEPARADLKKNNDFWDRYEGKAAEVQEKVNDTYLKANNQLDGVKSYGRIVDLMLAYYQLPQMGKKHTKE